MERNKSKSQYKYARISATKVRPVLDKVRLRTVADAERFLNFDGTKASKMVLKALKSAVANARVKAMNERDLVISHISADGGPVRKSWQPAARGRVNPILKRSAHINIELSEKGDTNGK